MILQTTDPYNTILKHQLQKTDTIIGENQSFYILCLVYPSRHTTSFQRL